MEASHRDPRRSLRFARRIVVKAGTPVLTHHDGNIALGRLGSLVEQIVRLRQERRDVVIVTSGAIGTGTMRVRKSVVLASTLGDSTKPAAGGAPPIAPENIAAAASVGQSLLMNVYETLFSKYNLACAQVLLTEGDIDDDDTLAQVCETTSELLELGIVPLLNDNDATTARTEPVFDPRTNEVGFDNDVLASRLASGLRADLLILLTDMDSLYARAHEDDPPTRLSLFSAEAKLVRSGIRFDVLGIPSMGPSERGEFTGRTRMSAEGLHAIIDAAKTATAGGVRAAVVTTGHHPLSLLRVVRGEDVGTLFLAAGSSL